jgi:hypothetical protein
MRKVNMPAFSITIATWFYNMGVKPQRLYIGDFGCTTFGYGKANEFGIFEYMLPFNPDPKLYSYPAIFDEDY